MANGTTQDALARRVEALSGGAPLPQAATSTIAKRLLGPGIADRYGDVIGTRRTELRDIARDFSLGVVSGDPFKADELKARVAQGYNEELRREEDQALQREQAAREQLNGFFQLLSQGKRVPRELRKEFFQEGLAKIGVEPSSPLFMKILSNYEKFGDVYDSLGDPEVQRLADEDPLGAVERLIEMGHDGTAALALAQSVQQMKRYRAETQHVIAQTKRLKGLAQEDPTSRARASFISRMAGRTVRDRLGRQRVLSPDQILQMADRYFPSAAPAAPAGPPQAPKVVPPLPPAAPAGLPQTTTTTPTTTGPAETVTPTTAGISQAPAKAAPSEPGKVRRITGTVTRVE